MCSSLVEFRTRIWRTLWEYLSLRSLNPLQIASALQLLVSPINYVFNYSWPGRGGSPQRLRDVEFGRLQSAGPSQGCLQETGLFEELVLPLRLSLSPFLFLFISAQTGQRRLTPPHGPAWWWRGSGVSCGTRAKAENPGDKIITNEREISGHSRDRCSQNGS